MDLVSIIYFLLIAGVVQGFGFNLVTICIKKKTSKVILFLNLIVLFISLNNLQAWLGYKGLIPDVFFLKHLLVPWYMLILPMFYVFAVHYLRIEDKVRTYFKLSIVIFLVELIVLIGVIGYVYYFVQDRDVSIITNYTLIENYINWIYFLFLFINAAILIFNRPKLLEFVMGYDDLNWIKWLIRLGVVVFFFWTLALAIDVIYGNETGYYLLKFGMTVLLYWIGYQGFYKYNVVQDRISLRSTIQADRVLISTVDERSKETADQDFFNPKHEKDFNRIKNHIIENKLYLDPLLSAESITMDMGISKSYLSKLINSYSNYNFSDFINSLRIEQAKKFLSDSEFSQYTNVSIGLECGFNSKSTFYSAFKKFTSQTPTDFKENLA
jgi:AraC-like DNA-binding protein